MYYSNTTQNTNLPVQSEESILIAMHKTSGCSNEQYPAGTHLIHKYGQMYVVQNLSLSFPIKTLKDSVTETCVLNKGEFQIF